MRNRLLRARLFTHLLFVIDVGDDLVSRPAGDFHWAHDLLDEGDLTFGEAILRVEVPVRPLLGPSLGRHEGVDLSRRVLRWLVQENQEARQATGEVGQNTFGLTL